MNFDRLNPLSRYLSFNGVVGNNSNSTNTNHSHKSEETTHQNQYQNQYQTHIQTQPSVVLSNDIETFVNPIEVSDWGIEGSVSSPTLSNQQLYSGPNHSQNHHFQQPSPLPHLYAINSRNSSINKYHHPLNDNFHQGYPYFDIDHHVRVTHDSKPSIVGTTENFSKFIGKYLTMEHAIHKFWEKFKYNIVISDFLDNSMILSKTEQSLSNLEHEIKQIELSHHCGTNITYYDDFKTAKLTILQKSYQVDLGASGDLRPIILIVSLIIKLLNQIKAKPALNVNHYTLFRYLITISSQLIKFYKFKWTIKSNQILSSLNQFLLLNYKVNKRLIQNLIVLKELEMFTFLNPGSIRHDDAAAGAAGASADNNTYKQQLKVHVIETLNVLNLNLKSSIKQLLPYLNGELLESYFNINNISLSDGDEMEIDEDTTSINYIVNRINRFNQLRRLFICQLLTLNEPSIKRNFFMYKLQDQFDKTGTNEEINNIYNMEKLTILQNVLHIHNSCISNMHSNFINFDLFYNSSSKPTFQEDQNILNLSTTTTENAVKEIEDDTNLVELISKLSNLTMNVKYFQKYNQSTKEINNIDELNEKILIFNQFNDDLTKIKQLYQSNINDLNNELFEFERERQLQHTPSVSTNSRRSSIDQPVNSNNGEFSLKSFHTSNSSIHAKKVAPPISKPNSRSPSLSFLSPKDQPTSTFSSGKKHKRVSTGLQLGLLTVFEDQQNNSQSTSSKNRRSNGNSRVSFDMDNYSPPTNYESYNQEAFNKLSSNGQVNTHTQAQARYSLNSVNSNISGLTDLINSSHITSYNEELIEGEGDGGTGNNHSDDTSNLQGKYSKSQLKLKLEESFNRIYNLENENKKLLNLKSEPNQPFSNNEITTTLTNNTIVESNPNADSHTTPSAFLTELDHVLAHKLSQPHLQG